MSDMSRRPREEGGVVTQQTFALGDIRPNPFRNIDRYPINRDKVEKLKESINRTDFWDNLVARIGSDGKPEIGYGHHRMVALREMYPDDHRVSLIVRDLDDAAMLHVMADENMQEWQSDGSVIVETVRAVRDFLSPGLESTGGRPSNGTAAIVSFLGWPEFRVRESIRIIEDEEAGTLLPEDTTGLSIKQASEMRKYVSRIPDPVVRKRAIARVREDLKEERIGKRGIGAAVHEVRTQSEPSRITPRVPMSIALALYREIDQFFRLTVSVNGQQMTRGDLMKEIAANRDAVELQGLTGPMADQIADALRDMASQAERFAIGLRAENEQLVAGGLR
jgi:hypothetical protein